MNLYFWNPPFKKWRDYCDKCRDYNIVVVRYEKKYYCGDCLKPVFNKVKYYKVKKKEKPKPVDDYRKIGPSQKGLRL